MSIALLCPHYRICGDLWHVAEVPNANYVGYNLMMRRFFDATDWRGFPQHARDACRRYSDTIHDLCEAGF